tara:strand:- start:22684 stop:23487 length:804 start_codon:yes stop_codon:yes gene_type:complete
MIQIKGSREVEPLEDSYIYNDDTYFADRKYATNSMLKVAMKKCPKEFFYYLDGETPTSEAFLIGSAFHCLVLENEEFDGRYAVAPSVDKRTKAGKEMYAEFAEQHGEKEILTTNQYNKITAMHAALLRHEGAMNLLSGGEAEKIFFWRNIVHETLCKAKIDYINEKDGYIVDVKTMQNTDKESFVEFAEKYNIYQQAAFYLHGTGMKDFYFIAVSKNGPMSVGIYKLSRTSLDKGRISFSVGLSDYKKCINAKPSECEANYGGICEI